MKKLVLLFAVILFASCSEDQSIKSSEIGEVDSSGQSQDCYTIGGVPENAVLINGLFEGDIIPDKRPLQKGFVVTEEDLKWEDKTIHYYYEETRETSLGTINGFDAESIAEHDGYAEEITNSTVFTLIKHDSKESLLEASENGVIIGTGFGGSSHLGKQGGIQRINLTYSDGSSNGDQIQRRTAFRMWAHTFGMKHELTKPGRDEEVIVFEENLYDTFIPRFEIQSGFTCNDGLDLNSITVWDSFEGSKNGEPTHTKINGETLEPNYEFSDKDKFVLEQF